MKNLKKVIAAVFTFLILSFSVEASSTTGVAVSNLVSFMLDSVMILLCVCPKHWVLWIPHHKRMQHRNDDSFVCVR